MIPPSLHRSEKIILSVLAFVGFLIHFITNLNGGYGFFRDELYYIACSDHLAWGFVDQPPFSTFLLKLSRTLLGDSLTAIRFIPALAHAGLIVLTGLMAKEMGGKKVAIYLSGLAMLMAPIYLAMFSFFSMNAIDIFIWALAMFIVLRIINTQQNSYWIILGVVLGMGLLNKISVLFLGAGIFVGLLLTNYKYFTTRWPYITGVIAMTFFLPYVLWNLNNDLAHLEFIHNASAGKYANLSRWSFVKEQLLFLNPISTPIWLGGIVALLIYKPLKPYRIFGWMFITAFLILFLNGTSKGEYLAPAYASLFSAATIWMEQNLIARSVSWIKYVYVVLLLISSTLLLPMVMPVLPVAHYITFSKRLGIEAESNENKELAELPQFYADMFGWKEKARDVAKVYNTLSAEDKSKCAIFSMNYGRCGAIDFFGEQYGLPKSIGNHNNYWIWGPREYTGEVMIILGGSIEDHQDHFASCEKVGVSSCTYCMPYENNVNIFLCRGLKYSLKEVWKEEKHYD